MEGQYPDRWKKKGNATGSGTPNINQQQNHTSIPPKPTANVATVPTTFFTPTGSGSGDEFYAFMTSVIPQTSNPITYADSAASDHFFVNISDFESYEPYTGRNGSTAKNGGTFPIHRKGTVRKRCVYDGRVINLIVKDALHCPSLSHNLVSIGKLDGSGCYAVFGGQGVTFIYPEGCPFIYGKGENIMYKIDIFPPTGSLPSHTVTPPDVAAKISAFFDKRMKALATKSHNRPMDLIPGISA